MTIFQLALSMETCICKEIKELLKNAPNEIAPLFEAIHKTQTQLELLINTAMHINIDTEPFPVVDVAILGTNASWKALNDNYANTSKTSIEDLISLWKIYTLIEKTAQFYQQSALNSPHPAAKLFFTSLSEIKHMLRRRIQGILQIMYNHIWSEIGFSPIVFGKD